MIYQILFNQCFIGKASDSATSSDWDKLLQDPRGGKKLAQRLSELNVLKNLLSSNSVIPSSYLLITMSLKSWLYDGIFIRHYNISTNIFFYKYLSD
ncbi:hypothetical protein X557_03935 [Francisella tularensis subsp. holarctica PHIT-FT049]|nr:hypothetical protein X557_03935 [Francisella tularensis subsp. holarctica PHIT-FT049]